MTRKIVLFSRYFSFFPTEQNTTWFRLEEGKEEEEEDWPTLVMTNVREEGPSSIGIRNNEIYILRVNRTNGMNKCELMIFFFLLNSPKGTFYFPHPFIRRQRTFRLFRKPNCTPTITRSCRNVCKIHTRLVKGSCFPFNQSLYSSSFICGCE